MSEPVRQHRRALLGLVRRDWTELWLVSPCIGADGLQVLFPYLRRDGGRVRVLTHLTPGRLADGKADPVALHTLRNLPGCEVRSLPDLASSIYAAGPEGPALVTGATLTLEGLDSDRAVGILQADAGPVLAELEQLWQTAAPVNDAEWAAMTADSARIAEARAVGEEIARVGAFVRVSVYGTRRTRRLDPHEFGLPEGEWGRAVRPVEVALFKLDEVIRAKEDLEAVLADKGIRWYDSYLVPRHFLERDWPSLFDARRRQLQERLTSPEGKANLKSQLSQARRELEAFFTELYPRVDSQGLDGAAWVDVQVTRVLTETVNDSILEESGLEYRVLTILPEDARSIEEMWKLLQDPKLRSVQLTFHF